MGIGGILAGIISIATMTITCSCMLFVPALLICTGGLLTITSPFAFLIENSATHTENWKINHFIHKTNADKEIVIKPGKVIDVLIFVKKNQYRPTFECILTDDISRKEIPFMIKLAGSEANKA